jgi:hypothetical protein
MAEMSDAFYLDDKGIPRKVGAEISLRDWFAGQALCALLANPEHANKDMDYGDFAHDAYVAADKMLAARDVKEGRPMKYYEVQELMASDPKDRELAELRAELAKEKERADLLEKSLAYEGQWRQAHLRAVEEGQTVELLVEGKNLLDWKRTAEMNFEGMEREISINTRLRKELAAAQTDLRYATGSHGYAEEEAATLRATLAEREAEIERLRAEKLETAHRWWKLTEERNDLRTALATARKEALESVRAEIFKAPHLFRRPADFVALVDRALAEDTKGET